MGRLVIRLLVLITARCIRHSFRAKPLLRGAIGVWAVKLAEPLQLLRGSLVRLPFD